MWFPAKLRWILSRKKMHARECNMRAWNQKVENGVALNKWCSERFSCFTLVLYGGKICGGERRGKI